MAGARDAPRPFPSSFSVGSAALSLLIDRQALRIGRLSPGEFSISNGTVDVKYQTWVGDGATGAGTLCVKTGGTLITPFISPNENGANTVEFNGGTVKATDLTATNPFLNNLTNDKTFHHLMSYQML